MKGIYTISQITQEIKVNLSRNFHKIWLIGEISQCTVSSSGHFYFTLKDQNAIISCVLFYKQSKYLQFNPQIGLKVECYGSVSVYSQRGQYQFIAEHIVESGQGELQLAFLKLKQKLADEGLFASERKRPIPAYVNKIGVITSLEAAALKDFLKTIEIEFPTVNIILYPTLVQGDLAAKKITEMIKTANKHQHCEVLVLTRGGGSIEDLWPFNEEIVARAISESSIPMITAIGHEVDFTIADFVSDLRCATPTSAAEYLSKSKKELLQKLAYLKQNCKQQINHKLQLLNTNYNHYSRERFNHLLEIIFNEKKIYLNDLKEQLSKLLKEKITDKQRTLQEKINLLDSLSPLKILKRGFVVVEKNQKKVTSIKSLQKNDIVNLRFAKGKKQAQII